MKKLIIIAITIIGSIFLYNFYFYHQKHTLLDKNIKSINSYSEILEPMKEWDENTLILFDVDDTLISSHDKLGKGDIYPFPLWFTIRMVLKHPKIIFSSVLEEYYCRVWKQVERFLIEPEIIPLIKNLQKQKCIILGLTAMESGSCGSIKSMPEWRYDMLKKFGIEFNKKFDDHSFTNLPLHRNNNPVLYRGIICTNQENKGLVLEAFLNYSNLKPEKIIFFDDLNKSLQSVAQTCKKRKIPFECYQYLGAKDFADKWNTERALLQMDNLIKYNKWITDKEADAILGKPQPSYSIMN
ncbi:DUF2608 domain-containing protein [Candidatus Babeliales bacterium]|nr:DUF2608 domain-containing protein [Candidatus Babeliales bacterium]